MTLAKPLGGRLFACIVCGTSMEWAGRGRHPYYCSDRCKWSRLRPLQTDVRHPSPNGCTVEGCDRPLQGRGLCKPHWKQQRRREGYKAPSDEWTERRQNLYHRRRAGGTRNGDLVLLEEVIARDGLACRWCGLLIDLELVYPHPWSKSLDHIQPVSRGGTHELDNVQLMHVACNSSKGARFS